MAKLRLMNAKELVKILEKLGFKFIHQEDNHMFFRHTDRRTTIIPYHASENIGRGLLLKIIKSTMRHLALKGEVCDRRSCFGCSRNNRTLKGAVCVKFLDIKKDLKISREEFEKLF